jgi:alpha-ketoglutarate-dependent taurine dioxygenase
MGQTQPPNVGVGPGKGEQKYWLADATYGEKPARAAGLRVQPPPLGGDTMFTDMAAAYHNLPDAVKIRIEPLTASTTPTARSFHPTYNPERSRWTARRTSGRDRPSPDRA